MTNRLGSNSKKNSSESSEYGSTSFTKDGKTPNDGDGKPGHHSKNARNNAKTIPAEENSSNNGTHHQQQSKESSGLDLTKEPSSSSNEKPHSLNFPQRYTPSKSDGNGEGNELETLQLVDRGHERELTNTEAILHLFKVFTGPSTIGMPAVMKTGGLLFGSIGFLMFGYLTAYGNIIIVNCGRLLCNRTKTSSLRYQELMELAILSYSDNKRIRTVATIVRNVTAVMLCLCQYGILAFYIQVIGTIMQSVMEQSDVDYDLPLWVTKIFISLALVPYSWMRNLKILSWFSMVANVSILVCVVTILQYAIRNLRPVDMLPLISEDLWTIPLFVSASVFTVEGVPMLLPIENRVQNPEAYGGLCGIITLAATGNIIINMTLGFYGYLCFGDSVPSNVLTALPNHIWYHIISLLYGLMVFLTFTLQLFLPAEFVVDALVTKSNNQWYQNYIDILVRTLLVVASYLLTCIVSDIGLIMSLTGAFCSVPLLFLFPSIGELVLLRKEPGGIPTHVLIRNIGIFVFGVITFIAGTFMAIVGIVDRFRQ